jgi:hypothetical protein
MAEAFSTFSAALSILDVSGRISAMVTDLIRNWNKAPTLILALSNEMSDLKILMDRVRDAGQTVRGSNTQLNTEFTFALDVQLQKATDYLGELEKLVDDLNRGKLIERRNKWLLKKSTAAKLQTQLRDVRLRINELLVVHNA